MMMLSGLLLLLATQGSVDHNTSPSTLHREVSWKEFCELHFDPDWSLPIPTQKEVGNLPIDLVAWFQEFATRDLNLSPGQKPGPKHEPTYLADLILELAPFRTDTKLLLKRLDEREKQLPGLSKSERRNLDELLCDAGLFHRKWAPQNNMHDDGILHLANWQLTDNKDRSELWRKRGGEDTVLRAATLVFADLESWSAAEDDCSSYFDQPGNRFEVVEIPAESRVRATAPNGDRYRAQIFRILSDLPFPFSNYGGDNRVRMSLRPDGLLMNEIYLKKNKDFHWLAGRDVFIPIETKTGQFICLLVVQEFGFDLDGVPESESSRKEAIRAALGNKKRGAEALFRPQVDLPTQRGRLPAAPKTEPSATGANR
ncbi:MAG: hypothetical protein MK209_00140 [Planctomycetes bacterium]|nr:hypothetical protein [Planctomycetota bacterium]